MIFLWILISLLAGVGFSLLLYFREKHSAIPPRQRAILATLRGITIFIVCLLLSVIMLNIRKKSYENPIIAILSDNSRSLILNKDSLYLKNKFKTDIDELVNNLKQKADVYQYEFDEDIRNNISFSFNGEQTDIYKAVTNIIKRYEGRNISGLLLITDGITNTGNDPSMLAEMLPFPVHTLGMGDTTSVADIVIKSIRFNKTAGYGNRFPVEVVIHATEMSGKSSTLVVKQDGKELFREVVNFNNELFSDTKTFIFDANQKGLTRIEIYIEPVENELNTSNNTAFAIIQIIDKKNRVAIVFQNPHPDITAIKSSLEDARNYEVELMQPGLLNSSGFSAYDAIILYQLPDIRVRSTIVDQIVASKIPYLMVIGQNTDLRNLASLNTGIRIQQNMQTIQEALPVLNNGFTLFQLSPELQRNISSFPPLLTHFGNYMTSENFQVLLYQKIGSVQTSSPMIAFATGGSKISAFIIGEGIYRWKLTDYMKNDNHLVFNEIIQKTVNLLVQQADKRRLRIHHKDIYYSSENAEMTAEVYNLSMEMITTPDVKIKLFNDEGNERELSFVPQTNDYRLNLGKLRAGKYSWNAKTNIDGTIQEASGMFYVENINIEQVNITANHNLLKYLSSVSGGRFFTLSEFENIDAYILNNSDLNNLEYTQESSEELISIKWLLILLILLLSAEWAARKYLGSY